MTEKVRGPAHRKDGIGASERKPAYERRDGEIIKRDRYTDKRARSDNIGLAESCAGSPAVRPKLAQE